MPRTNESWMEYRIRTNTWESNKQRDIVLSQAQAK